MCRGICRLCSQRLFQPFSGLVVRALVGIQHREIVGGLHAQRVVGGEFFVLGDRLVHMALAGQRARMDKARIAIARPRFQIRLRQARGGIELAGIDFVLQLVKGHRRGHRRYEKQRTQQGCERLCRYAWCHGYIVLSCYKA